MLNVGIEPFLVASSVNLIAAQRLLRRLCVDCKGQIDVPEQSLIDLGAVPEELESYAVQHGKGCRTCNNTGYKGRVAVYEIMPMTDELAEFVLNGASTLKSKRSHSSRDAFTSNGGFVEACQRYDINGGSRQSYRTRLTPYLKPIDLFYSQQTRNNVLYIIKGPIKIGNSHASICLRRKTSSGEVRKGKMMPLHKTQPEHNFER